MPSTTKQNILPSKEIAPKKIRDTNANVVKMKDSGLDPVDLITGSFFITMKDYIAKDIGEDFVI